MTWFREHIRELVSFGAGLMAAGVVLVTLPAAAAPVQVATADGTFPLTCVLAGQHLSCEGDLPTANPTPPPTTAPPTTTPPVTTPPPTTPPTPTPTPSGIGSFATGPAGGSGIPAGTTLTPFAGNVTSGTTYTARDFTSLPITVTASNITFRNCNLPHGVVFTGNNVTVDHCTIHGGISLSGGDNFVFNGNDVTGWDDGLHITSDSGTVFNPKVTGNWIHQPSPTCADHSDGIQVLGVSGALFSGNVIDLGRWIDCSNPPGSNPGEGPLNGAFQFENTQGPVSGVIVSRNLLNGGGFILRAYAGTRITSVTGNGFGPDSQFGPADTLQSTITTWSGNFVVATGATVPRA